MSESTGCKIAITALIVAIIMGGLGFATGFITHTVLVAGEPRETRTVVLEVTAMPSLAEPTATPTEEQTPSSAGENKAFALFWEVWNLVQRDFYGQLPTDEEMTYGAIRGATSTLDDPYTAFIEPRTAAIMREDASGSFEGIGAFVGMHEGRLEIVGTIKDQPAERAGLRPGDIVLQADDTPIENMSIYEAITLIRGPAGTKVRLTILREGQERFEVEITRARMDIPVLESEMRQDGIAYVSLFGFNSDASAKLEKAVEEMLAKNPKGLILDLRGNPGGFLHEAALTAGLFLPEEDVVLIERSKEGEERLTPQDFGAGDLIAPDIPMVVLVNGSSASASEIVAGALQDHGRAILIGEKTFGKGLVQLVYELSNGAELRVTKARWFTPNDRAIHGEGLDPDIVVEVTPEDVEAGLDPQLDRAVDYLLTGE